MKRVFTLLSASTLAVGASLGLTQTGQCQTIASIIGGSSALQGDFRVASFHEGAIPQIIGTTTFGITNYKNSGQGDKQFVSTNVIVTTPLPTGGTLTETVSDAEVRFNPANLAIIVLLRSDSGIGVRYVANGSYISTWGAFTYPDGKGLTDTTSTYYNSNASTIAAYLTGHTGSAGEPIDSALADVTADSVAQYAQIDTGEAGDTGLSGLNVNNLAKVNAGGLVKNQLPIQTLLALYNPTGSNPAIPTNAVYNLTQGTIQGDYEKPTNPPSPFTKIFRREDSSGTRMTFLLDILGKGDLEADPDVVYASTKTSPEPVFPTNPLLIETGTGSMLNVLNNSIVSLPTPPGGTTTYSSLGYSFISGTAGNGRPNIRVAKYNGNLPYSPSVAGTDLSLPGNNGQAAYSQSLSSYFTGVTAGTYTNWSYANSYSLNTKHATMDSIASSLNGSAKVAHSEGLTVQSDLSAHNVKRASFVSTITGETVTDGGTVTHN